MAASPRAGLVKEPPLPIATDAPPGSPEKIELMRHRQAAGQQIFHPQDAKIEWERYTVNDELISLRGLFEALADRCSDAE